MANQNGGFTEKLKGLWPFALMALVGISAYFLTSLAIPEVKPTPQAEVKKAARSSIPVFEEPIKFRKAERKGSPTSDLIAADAGAIANQRIVVFKDQAALAAFLAKMGDGVSVLGRLDSLNALLIGFGNEADLTALLDGTEETSFNFPASIPEFESVGPQEGAVEFGDNLLEWLGVEGDNSLWGKGFRIAIIDTGIADHPVFKNAIERINLIPLPENLEDQHGHGTAMGTFVSSDHPFAPGVAPAATIISIRAAGEDGRSSMFTLMEALEAAIMEGADFVNFSIGGPGKSSSFESLIKKAVSQGMVIVAAAGNTGREGVLYPGAYSDVITFGAVDRKNQPMDYSTSGPQVAAAAPGYKINAAYPYGKAAKVSGTSPAAPIGLAVMAAIGSNTGSPRMTARQSADHFLSHLHDIGSQGRDNRSGGGVPNVGTMIFQKAYDASVNSITIQSGSSGSTAQVLVQNVGTKNLWNTGVTVSINGVNTRANITSLAPMESTVVNIPISARGNMNILGSVQVSGTTDQRATNNSLSRNVSFSK